MARSSTEKGDSPSSLNSYGGDLYLDIVPADAILDRMLKRIVVPLDGTPLGEAVLGNVAELARALGAEIDLVHVVPPSMRPSVTSRSTASPWSLGGAASILPAYSPSSTVLSYQYDPGEVESNRLYMERVAAWLRTEGLDATATVIEGPDVANEILRRAAGAELLALAASYGQPRIQIGRLVNGSISERIIHESLTPVFLMRVPYATG